MFTARGTLHEGAAMPDDHEQRIQLDIVVESAEGRRIVKVVGEFDRGNANEVRSCLNDLIGAGFDVVVDLSELRFIDSTGLGVLVGAHKFAKERGRSLTLRRPSSQVAKGLEVTGIARVIAVEE
jgi:anti-sigma B factor antagonist